MTRCGWFLVLGAAGVLACSSGDGAPGGAGGAAESAPVVATGDPGSATSARAPRDGAARDRGIMVIAGTSITAGLGLPADSAYPQLLQRKIDSAGVPFDVVNAGVSGETTAGLLRRLDWLLRGDFDVFVIESGANDGLRGIAPATMQENLRQIIDRVRAARPDATLLLVQMEAPPNLGRDYTTQFREVFPGVAKEKGIPLLPFPLEGVAGVAGLNQGDGIHPNQDGAYVVAENVWRSVRGYLVRD